jgi:hypothetical protein
VLIVSLLGLSLFDYPNAQADIIPCHFPLSPSNHLCVNRTDCCTDATPFAVFQIKTDHLFVLCVYQDARIGAEQPALKTVGAGSLAADWTKSPPATSKVLDCIPCL